MRYCCVVITEKSEMGVKANWPLVIYSPDHDHMVDHMFCHMLLFTTVCMCTKLQEIMFLDQIY